MDYNRFFSEDVSSFLRSPVREIFRKVDLSAIASFAGGYPAAVTFPVADIPALTEKVLEKYGAKALQYGATQGVPELRESIAKRYGVPVSQVQITTSSQQGIDVCTRILVNPGDIVLSNDPTYLGALQSFKAYRATVMSIEAFRQLAGGTGPEIYGHPRPYKGEGPVGKADGRGRSEAEAISGPVPPAKFIYVIPDFNNPSGKTMTLEEREELVRVARELDILIVEDSPYRELRYDGEQVKTIRELAPERTLHLGSFSKIFAPGFRLGWIIGPEELLEQIYVCKQSLDLCPPVLDQYLAAEFLSSGALDANLKKTIAEYRRRRDLMVSLLEKYMPEGVSWTYPEGGLFLWLTLPEDIDTVALYDRALTAGVAYVAGSFFYTDGSHRNTLRLNFSFIEEAKMEPGIRLLASLITAPTLHKFSGAGNDFVVLDGRNGGAQAYRQADTISRVCRRYKTDGLMILTEAPGVDFAMEFYNPDGSGGMMCGNGGRCITAFADSLGIKPSGDTYVFKAPDGLHSARILSHEGNLWTVRLRMIDVKEYHPSTGGWFLNTGTRHLVLFVPDIEAVDMVKLAPSLRWKEEFQPEGTNVNFVQVRPDGLHVRTFEKGVEGETLACGTGLTASALAAWKAGFAPSRKKDGTVEYRLQCRRGDWLTVEFKPAPGEFTGVYLTGPAELV